MEFRRILLPFDFSEAAEYAARYAGGLAAFFGAEVTMMHVLPQMQYDFSLAEPLPGRLQEVRKHRTANARQALKAVMPCLGEAAATARIEVTEGGAAEEILSAANSSLFDAVVMSTRGASTFRRLFTIGSVTSKVLHEAEPPVITSVHFEDQRFPPSIHRVLCAVDLGPQTMRVLDWGSRAAVTFGASLQIVHVASDPGILASDEEAGQWRSSACRRLTARIQELQNELAMEGAIHIAFGNPAKAISALAADSHADLVVLGRGVAHDMIGRLRATAYDIIRQCPCPVASI